MVKMLKCGMCGKETADWSYEPFCSSECEAKYDLQVIETDEWLDQHLEYDF